HDLLDGDRHDIPIGTTPTNTTKQPLRRALLNAFFQISDSVR
ncbi:MAG: hypothetical protein ACI8Z5_002696, partial [Lentimonas sp.]